MEKSNTLCDGFARNLRRLHLLALGEPLLCRRWALCEFCSLDLLTGWLLENLLPCLLPFSTMFLDSPIYFIPAGGLEKAHWASVCFWETIQQGDSRNHWVEVLSVALSARKRRIKLASCHLFLHLYKIVNQYYILLINI